MIKRLTILILFSTLASMLLACSASVDEQEKENTIGYFEVSVDEAYYIYKNEEMIILDVRTEQEYKEGHIPGAILIPLQELESRLDELDKEEKYLIVCRSGSRSAQASEILVSNGFKHITNMQGGMLDWKYDIEKS